MRHYILKRHIDRYAPGADVTGLYPVEDLERWAKEGMVRVMDVEDPPVALDDLVNSTVEPAVEAPVTKKRK